MALFRVTYVAIVIFFSCYLPCLPMAPCVIAPHAIVITFDLVLPTGIKTPLFTFITIHYSPACSTTTLPITLPHYPNHAYLYNILICLVWLLSLDCLDLEDGGNKFLQKIGNRYNQNIVISQKTLIFINTGVWTSDFPRNLILSIKHTEKQSVAIVTEGTDSSFRDYCILGYDTV